MLRALKIPAGKHEVVMEFRPASVSTTNAIGYTALALVLILFVGALVMAVRKSGKPTDHANDAQ